MRHLSKIIITLFIIWNNVVYGQNSKHEILDVSYLPESVQTKLEIDNNFGNISVATWTKDSISIRITLEVDGYDKQESQEIIDEIKFNIIENNELISIKSDIKKFNKSISSRKKTFKINYEINMPDNLPISLKNEFGNIFMADYNGAVEIDLEYGDFTAGLLKELNLRHEFGKTEIESITNGEFELSYVDEFSLQKAESVEIESEFSKIYIKEINKINFDAEYGKLIVGSVSNYTGKSEFSEITIDNLYENFDLDAEYASGTIVLKSVSKDIRSFNLNTEFSKSEINIESGANLKFNTKHSFGKLKTEGRSIVFSKKIKDMSDEEYEGTIGNEIKQNSTVLRIKTSYGACSIEAN